MSLPLLTRVRYDLHWRQRSPQGRSKGSRETGQRRWPNWKREDRAGAHAAIGRACRRGRKSASIARPGCCTKWTRQAVCAESDQFLTSAGAETNAAVRDEIVQLVLASRLAQQPAAPAEMPLSDLAGLQQASGSPSGAGTVVAFGRQWHLGRAASAYYWRGDSE